MNHNRMKATRIAVATLLGTLGAASAIPPTPKAKWTP